MTPRISVLFVGQSHNDRVLFREAAVRIGATPILNVNRALALLIDGALGATVIGNDVDDASTTRIIELARRVHGRRCRACTLRGCADFVAKLSIRRACSRPWNER
jgi:hypothetical protein